MKKLLAILFLFAASLGSAQNLVSLTKTGNIDQNGTFKPITSATVFVSNQNISSVEASGSGSYVYLKAPQKLVGSATITGYSVTSTPAQIAALVSSTAVNIPVQTAYTTSATVTASELQGGLLANTGTVAVTLTLPTTSLIAAQLGAAAGSNFEFSVLNNASGGTITMAVGSGMTASDFPGTNTLTRTASATVGIARFRIHFLSATVSTLTRIN